MKTIGALLSALLLAGCASTNGTLRDRAEGAAVADVASTGAGLALAGDVLVEGNVLGPFAMLLKPAVLKMCADAPTGEQEHCYASVSAVWSGMAANNLCLIGATLAGGPALASLCPAFGLGWAMADWQITSDEREYAAWCAQWIEQTPGNHCLPFRKPA